MRRGKTRTLASTGTVAPSKRPIIFVLGPSGAGKSTLAAALGTKLGFMHLEIDRYPEDGIDVEGLREEWDAFWLGGNALDLANVLQLRVTQRKAPGAVLSFPSGVVPTAAHISAALSERITPVVLYGTHDECLNAFLSRETASGRNLSVAHWTSNNAGAHAAFGAPLFSLYRVNAFADGKFRHLHSLITEVQKRAG